MGEPEEMRSFWKPVLNSEKDIKIDVEQMACEKMRI